ncbi:MAG TPA: nitrile hydratase subunit beta [Steroidobacteraceae bacterium]|jgi:nitrile hydratase beta subunit|nr:nitrile hydratase subunit beta [Steroidobacteraceae bacterium]
MSYHSNADLGGQDVRDRVSPEPEGELFHADWEPRVLALTLAMNATGLWNIDASRAARETLPHYRELSYYQIWLAGLEKLLHRSGAAQPDEIDQGRALHAAVAASKVLHAGEVAAVLARGSPTVRKPSSPARYALGMRVRTLNVAPPHHTRLPGYTRGKCGVVERIHGAHVFADTHAQGLGEQPQWLYTVAFDEAELWGVGRPRQGLTVSVDAWEPYLEPA